MKLINSTLRFDTAQLGPLRDIIKKFSALNLPIGEIIQFCVVVDANSVIADLAYKVRHPDRGLTALEELIKATVVVAHAPYWLEAEMASAIPQVAERRNLPIAALWLQWQQYRSLLVWDETFKEPADSPEGCCDPKDLPYVGLERKVRADGILTKDAHIAKLGGHPLTPDFVMSTRDYARATVTTLSIRVLGVVLPTASLLGLAAMLRGIARTLSALPPQIKALIVCSGIFALVHPGSRRWIVDRCAALGEALAPVFDTVMEVADTLAAMDTEAKLKADTHLAVASALVKPKFQPARRRRRVTQSRAKRTQSAPRALPITSTP